MFLPYFIALFLGLVCPSHTTNHNHNTTVSTNDAPSDPEDLGDDGTGGTGTGGTGTGGGTGSGTGTGGDTGQLPPPKP